MYFEMPNITPRICGICPVSHHLASAKAGDALMNCPPPRPANLLRELMHMGQIIQSHGMHFFELAGPDLLLGFDSDPATRNVVGLIGANPALAVKAVELRKYGQEIIHTLGGRRIHPVFAVPGGVNKALRPAERDGILQGVDNAIATIQVGIQIILQWAQANMEDINKFAVFPTGYFGLVTPENGLELYDGQIRLIGSDGNQLEKFDGKDYLDVIAEHVENWSYPAGQRGTQALQDAEWRETSREHALLPLCPTGGSPVRGRARARAVRGSRHPLHGYPQHPPAEPGLGRGCDRSPTRHADPPLLG
jgi:NAD-reducing hydrogenase large subunit